MDSDGSRYDAITFVNKVMNLWVQQNQGIFDQLNVPLASHSGMIGEGGHK
jgi:hypothetical protein